jgi:hypothetical protein
MCFWMSGGGKTTEADGTAGGGTTTAADGNVLRDGDVAPYGKTVITQVSLEDFSSDETDEALAEITTEMESLPRI